MKITEKNTLYSFSINLEKEVEETVEKKKKRKNKETGKMEVVTSSETISVKKEIPHRIIIKKPNRVELEEGDMFYSLELNKYIKMGLLTKAMLAKQYGNQGGVWSEKEQKIYAELLYKMHQKQLEIQEFSILNENGTLSERQKEKLNQAIKEMSYIKRDLTEYEMVQNSLFDHTADVKARNRAIMWYILHLTYFEEGDADDVIAEGMFEGEDFDEKYSDYQDQEEEAKELFEKAIDKISSIITIWYVGGNQDSESIDKIFDEMKNSKEEGVELEDDGDAVKREEGQDSSVDNQDE
jgi:hypothetical protein